MAPCEPRRLSWASGRATVGLLLEVSLCQSSLGLQAQGASGEKAVITRPLSAQAGLQALPSTIPLAKAFQLLIPKAEELLTWEAGSSGDTQSPRRGQSLLS